MICSWAKASSLLETSLQSCPLSQGQGQLPLLGPPAGQSRLWLAAALGSSSQVRSLLASGEGGGAARPVLYWSGIYI